MPHLFRGALVIGACLLMTSSASAQQHPRARSLGIYPGDLPPGPSNAITDVPGVRVGQVTVRAGDSVNTGVTAILPHPGNVFQDRVPAAIHVANGFGKLLGSTQVTEEAIYNSVLTAQTVIAKGGTVEALPVSEVARILDRHGMLRR